MTTIGNVLTFIVVCVSFIISAVAYSNITHKLSANDISDPVKKETYNQVKGLSLVILLLSGLAIMIQAYMLLFTKGTYQEQEKFLGVEKCDDTEACTGPESITIN